MDFFKFFPQTAYKFQVSDDATPFELRITNPTVRVKIQERLRDHISAFYDYIIQDGDRPDTIAQNVYGSPSYTWLVLLANNILSLYDWPLTNEEFNNYITERYGSVSAAQAETTYYTADGDVVDNITYNAMDASERGSTSSAYDDELEANEAKRRIKIIPAGFAESLVLELRKLTA